MKDKLSVPKPAHPPADGWLGFDSRQGRLLAGEVTRTGTSRPEASRTSVTVRCASSRACSARSC
jgi:hypothetical protein